MESLHTRVAHLAILHGVVIANHIEVKEILNLLQRSHRMLGIPLRATQVGILAREGYKVHIVLGLMLGIVRRECYDSRRTRGVVVRSRIINLLAQYAQMVVVRRKDVARIVALTLNLGYYVKALITLQELILDVDSYALGSLGE